MLCPIQKRRNLKQIGNLTFTYLELQNVELHRFTIGSTIILIYLCQNPKSLIILTVQRESFSLQTIPAVKGL